MPKQVSQYVHRENGEIEFFTEEGALWFSYYERVAVATKHHRESWRIYSIQGQIPLVILGHGEDSLVRFYAKEEVDAYLVRKKEEERQMDEKLSNLNHPLEFSYDGVRLAGRVLSYVDTALTVQLDEPYQGQKYVIYGFGAAMAGLHAVDANGDLTEDGIESAHRLLVAIYEREKQKVEHGDMINLADRLNSAE